MFVAGGGRLLGWMLPVVLLAGCAPAAEDAPRSPGQPASGPGGADYAHAAVTQTLFGEGARQYYLFEPADPIPPSAPLVIFLHGWTVLSPQLYGAWIEHLVRKGNILLFPCYQDSLMAPDDDFLPKAAQATAAALAELQAGAHVQPDLGHIAIIGYSFGAQIAANLVAQADQFDLPRPKALMCIDPQTGDLPIGKSGTGLADLGAIPPDTLVLVVTGHPDSLVGDGGGRAIFDGLTQVLPANKDFVAIRSDNHGSPPLIANHAAPMAIDPRLAPQSPYDQLSVAFFSTTGLGQVDAVDYYGFWKLCDGLCDAAFYDRNREYALGNTPQQRFMGTWSDGVPVQPLLVLPAP